MQCQSNLCNLQAHTAALVIMCSACRVVGPIVAHHPRAEQGSHVGNSLNHLPGLMQVIQCHQTFLADALQGTLLNQPAVIRRVQELEKCAQEFCKVAAMLKQQQAAADNAAATGMRHVITWHP